MIHSIVAKWAFDKAEKGKKLSSRCPRCGFKPIADEQKSDAPVFCKDCGCEIPARISERGKAKKETGK